MQNFSFTILTTIFLTSLTLFSCNQISKSEDKDKVLTEKENELLKKENELLKKELELKKESAKTKTDNQTTKQQQANISTSENLEFLKNLNGKYPDEVKLLDNPALIKRLKKLLGNRFKFLKETWAVESPIKIKDNIFVASGCQAHNCGSTNFIIVVDLSKNVMLAGVREEDQVKTYSEDGSSCQQLLEWANRN
jgi:flagellar biosynthesis component FlhA